MIKKLLYFLLFILVGFLFYTIPKDLKNSKINEANINKTHDSVSENNSNKKNNISTVSSYITRNGKFVKAHGRKTISTDPKASMKRAKSRYYYKTHKYIISERRKKENK